MSELWYGHFDSTPEDQRLLLAADWARFIASFVTNGIRNGGTNLQVTAGTGMNVNVDNGIACILGYIVEIIADLNGRYYQVTVPAANPQYPRIDRLVLRLDRRIQERSVKPVIKTGTAASTPVPPTLTRSQDIWELSLAQIRVNANASIITSGNITDERFDTELCGLMNSVLGLDPSMWRQQFESFLADIAADSQQSYDLWESKYESLRSFMLESFNGAMDGWENDIQEIKTTFATWFATINADLQRYSQFDFDNLAALPGVTVKPMVEAANTATETIVISGTSIKVAEMVTDFSQEAQNIIVERETVYVSDGLTPLRTATITTNIETGEVVVTQLQADNSE